MSLLLLSAVVGLVSTAEPSPEKLKFLEQRVEESTQARRRGMVVTLSGAGALAVGGVFTALAQGRTTEALAINPATNPGSRQFALSQATALWGVGLGLLGVGVVATIVGGILWGTAQSTLDGYVKKRDELMLGFFPLTSGGGLVLSGRW